ncbi:reticulon-4b isoform X1 [Paramisgurnus dabryanus]|uniref:reticulon-4b isoform X1 n=1 Tax=Paramisgurnus dabryanus TaxID=90735 RepID=UPI0031F3AA7B
MDEADKVSSCTPDKLLKNQSDKSMQHADDEIIAPQTNEEIVTSQTNEEIVTSQTNEEIVTSQTNEETVTLQTNETFITSHTISVEAIPPAVEISISLKTTEVTVTAHRAEETYTSQMGEDPSEITRLNNTSHQETVTWTSQRTEDAAERSPQHPEVGCVSAIKEEIIALNTSDVTSEISPVTASSPAISEVSSTSAAAVVGLQTDSERNTHLISGDLQENKPSLHTHERAALSAPTSSSVSAFVSAPQFTADLWDSPAVVSQDNSIPTMDSFSKISGGFDSDVLNQSDDDLLVEPKDCIFSSDNDAKEGLTATRRSVEVSDSPSPDLVQDAYDGDENEYFTQPQEIEQFSVSSMNKEGDDRPTTLPDILKSSPLNPDKADSGSSEGSPDISPAHKSEDSQNVPLSVSASNLFGFDSKILLLKEMAEETEARAVEKAKLDAEKISEQSFVAFDLVKETGLPLKSEQVLKDEEAEMSSQTYVQMSDKFECLNFLNEKNQEHSDSDSPTADSFSPVLDAVAKQTSCFHVEQGITAVREEIEAIDEVSEQEVSSEEFEFVERPPQGVPDEFLELHDSSTIPKPSEMPVDDEQSPSLELPYQIPATQDTQDQRSCHLLSQQSDDSFPVRGKAGLESVPQGISPVSLNHTPVDKTGFEKMEAKVSNIPSLRPATVVDLLYWRNLRSSAVVFGSSLLLLLSISTCSIISVITYVTLALLSVTVTIRIYKGILQAIQKSDEGHPFKQYLDKDVGFSTDLVQKYSDMALSQINSGLIELRHLFLVEDLVDSLKFAVFLWIMTYVGAMFNGLTLLILGLVGAFTCPVIYEKHQTEIDQYISMVKTQIKDIFGKIQAKVPGMKKLE